MEKVFETINNFTADDPPLLHDYTFSMPIIFLSVYLVFVKVGPKLMKNRKKIEGGLASWNLFLAVLSLAMFIGMAVPCLKFYWERGFIEFLCLPGRELYHGSQFFWVWLFAISKYFELIDTVFVVIRKREVEFLHYYHHTTVLLFTWFCVITLPGGVGYMFSIMNAGVHTIMYYYFYKAAIGKRPSWGQTVTIIQLSQMVVGVIFSATWIVNYLDGVCKCDYAYSYFFSSVALYGSYFVLFLQFYYRRYFSGKKPAPTPAPPVVPLNPKKDN